MGTILAILFWLFIGWMILCAIVNICRFIWAWAGYFLRNPFGAIWWLGTTITGIRPFLAIFGVNLGCNDWYPGFWLEGSNAPAKERKGKFLCGYDRETGTYKDPSVINTYSTSNTKTSKPNDDSFKDNYDEDDDSYEEDDYDYEMERRNREYEDAARRRREEEEDSRRRMEQMRRDEEDRVRRERLRKQYHAVYVEDNKVRTQKLIIRADNSYYARSQAETQGFKVKSVQQAKDDEIPGFY